MLYVHIKNIQFKNQWMHYLLLYIITAMYIPSYI